MRHPDKNAWPLLKSVLVAALVTLTVVWPSPPSAAAAGLPLAQTFLNPTPETDDRFGSAVAWVDGKVLVAAVSDDSESGQKGAAYLFDAKTRALLRTFYHPNPSASSLFAFGDSVAGVGGDVLVSDAGDNTGATNAGAAYLFDSTTGALLQTFLSPTPTNGDRFGRSVAEVGGNVLIGAFGDDTAGPGAGAAYLFDAGTGALLQSFFNPNPALANSFGSAVAGVSGNVLIGGLGATGPGAAYLFDSSTGVLLHTFLSPTPALNDRFGGNVAGVGGDVLVSGGLGKVYLFDGASGALLQTFHNPSPVLNDNFGTSLADLAGDVLVGTVNVGKAYLFDAGTADLIHTFTNPFPAASSRFGTSLAGFDGKALIGDSNSDAGATDAGAAYLFAPPNDEPININVTKNSFQAKLAGACWLISYSAAKVPHDVVGDNVAGVKPDCGEPSNLKLFDENPSPGNLSIVITGDQRTQFGNTWHSQMILSGFGPLDATNYECDLSLGCEIGPVYVGGFSTDLASAHNASFEAAASLGTNVGGVAATIAADLAVGAAALAAWYARRRWLTR